MAKVWIPSLLRGLTGGLSEVQADGATVRQVIEDLERRYPGIAARLIEAGQDRLKPNLTLVVDGVNSKQGLRHPVSETSEIHFVPAMSGGGQPGRDGMWMPLRNLRRALFGQSRTAPGPSAQQLQGAPPADVHRGRAVAMLILAIVISIAVIVLSTRFRDALIAFGQLGLAGLFVLSVVGNATVLIPAPAFVVACAAAPIYGVLATGLVAGTGSALGEMTGYMAGYGGTAVLPQGRTYQRLHNLMENFGPLVIFLMALVPNPMFDVGGLMAGVLRMHPLAFLLAAIAGKSVRLILVALACNGGLPFLTQFFDPNQAP